MIDYAKLYKLDLMSNSDIKNAVALGELTAAQYLEITGEEYVAPVINSVITELKTNIAKLDGAVYTTSEFTAKRLEDAEANIKTLQGGV